MLINFAGFPLLIGGDFITLGPLRWVAVPGSGVWVKQTASEGV